MVGGQISGGGVRKKSQTSQYLTCKFMFLSHLVALFDDGLSAVPVGRVKNVPATELAVGMDCEVQWYNKKFYPAKVLCIGM